MDAPINIRIDYREVIDAFNRLKAGATDMTPAMKLAGVFAVGAVQGNFDRQATPDGVPWAALKRPRRRNVDASRAKSRRLARLGMEAVEGIATQILVDKGFLRGGIHFEAFADHVDIATSAQVEAKAAALNFGYPPNNLPAREYMGLRPEDQSIVAEIFDRYLQGLADREMGGA